MRPLKKLNARLLYTARCSVFRARDFATVQGATGQKWERVPALSDLPCRLSYGSRNALGNRGRMDMPQQFPADVNEIKATISLYCDPGHSLRAGDRVYVEFAGKTKAYWAGEPSVYPFYQHILLLENREA